MLDLASISSCRSPERRAWISAFSSIGLLHQYSCRIHSFFSISIVCDASARSLFSRRDQLIISFPQDRHGPFCFFRAIERLGRKQCRLLSQSVFVHDIFGRRGGSSSKSISSTFVSAIVSPPLPFP